MALNRRTRRTLGSKLSAMRSVSGMMPLAVLGALPGDTSVDRGAAWAALARLAVPAAGQVVGLRGLETVDDVEDDHALVGLHAVVLGRATTGVSAKDAHRDGRHHLRSWKSAFSSAGISGRASRLSRRSAPSRRCTTLTLPH